MSEPLYAVKRPEADAATQRHIVSAADGVEIYVQVWLPAAKDGKAPPARVPVILDSTPYATETVIRLPEAIAWFVPRGYAFAQMHVRGTGESGGCIEQTASKQIDDGARDRVARS